MSTAPTTPAAEAAQIAREVLDLESQQLGRRPRVAEPITFTLNGKQFRVTPCSGKHRAWHLTGYVVLSCDKCKREQVES